VDTLLTARIAPPLDRTLRQQTFDRVLAEYGPALARLARAYEYRPAVAEELQQEIALALWQALPSFRGESSEKTFVFRVATNRALTHVAQRAPAAADLEAALDVPDAGPGPESAASTAEQSARLVAAVAALPLSLRQVVSLALEGLSQAEIGQVLGLAENNVAVRMHRSKVALRERLGVA
jgi:RNA polymerase sigma factor (sigma-70 family)